MAYNLNAAPEAYPISKSDKDERRSLIGDFEKTIEKWRVVIAATEAYPICKSDKDERRSLIDDFEKMIEKWGAEKLATSGSFVPIAIDVFSNFSHSIFLIMFP